MPDASAGHELTISLFKHLPFTDGDTGTAAFVAVQDGDGPWTAVTAEQGVYHAHLAADRYGVAIGCRIGDSSSVEVFQRAAADGLDVRTRSCAGEPVQLDVSVHNVPPGSFAYVSTAGQSVSGDGNATYSFRIQPGPTDLFASLTDGTGIISKLVRVPMFDAASMPTVEIDFSRDGAAPDARELVVALAEDAQAQVETSVILPTGAYPLSGGAPLGAPSTYQTLPAALQHADDLFDITVTAGARAAAITSKAPGALAFQLPADVAAPAPTMALTPALHPVFSFDPGVIDLPIRTYQLHARTSSAPDDVFREWSVELSSAWIPVTSPVTYEFPDLSAVAGFSPDFVLFSGPLRWAVRRVETSAAAAVDGRITRSASRAGTIAEYCGDHVVQPPETCDPPDGTTCSDTCTKL